MSYEALVLLPADCVADLKAAEALLRKTLPQMRVSYEDQTLALSDGWEIRIGLNDEAHVIEESQEIVEEFGASRPDADRLATANRRFEVSTDPDPDMDRFNDYVLVLETLMSFEGAAAFDPQAGEFV
jgi:hypothetical protein